MRTITGLFDTRAEAERAIQMLVSTVGVERGGIQIHAQDATATTGTATAAVEDRGFWASLRDLFVPDEDRAAYSEGIRRGGTLVVANVEDPQVDRAMDALEEAGAVDLDHRENEWRTQGWAGYGGSVTGTAGAVAASAVPHGSYGGDAVVGASSSTTATGMAAMPAAATARTGAVATGAVATGAVATGAAATRTMGATGGEEIIPIVAESLVVGKREMDRGRVRVRSYVVETPVSEQVTLRTEHVDISRRAVDLPASAADQALFAEKIIEATEHSEEAVVAKDVRVVEELVVRKGVEQETRTVSDTVRKTEVEVVDERHAGTVVSGTTVTGTATATGGTTGTVKPKTPGV